MTSASPSPLPLALNPAKEAIAHLIYKALETLLREQAKEASNPMSFEEVAALLETPPELAMGDLALPCFRFARLLKRKPQDIAQALSSHLEATPHPWLEKCEAVGAFLNLFFAKPYLASYVIPKAIDGSLFHLASTGGPSPSPRVMVEFSQPNTHKEFHIGHGRNVCLGDALARILAYRGFTVVPVNYIGDEGAHVAKCLWQVARLKADQGETPATKSAEWYGKRYVEANAQLREAEGAEKETYQRQLSHILAALEAQQGPYFELWKESREACLKDFDRIYSWLGVHFDHIFYESEVSQESQSIVDEYIAKGLFIESQGAWGIPMEDSGLGFFMARKSDGTSLYITKDLALARRKFRDFAIDRSIYVVGHEQNFHFRQLFKALELMGFPQAKECYHLSYAHVTLPEGKISSRQGNAITFAHLQNLILAELHKHLEKYQGNWTAEEIAIAAHRLAVAAIKYGMLASDPQKEITFDPAAWTSFDGNSGPYLMYTYARSRSILRTCAQKGYQASQSKFELLTDLHEHELLRYIYDFNACVHTASELYKPSPLANYLFNMCKSFNRFYANLSVLNAEQAEVRAARMSLIEAFANTLAQGLQLLGITPLEKM